MPKTQINILFSEEASNKKYAKSILVYLILKFREWQNLDFVSVFTFITSLATVTFVRIIRSYRRVLIDLVKSKFSSKAKSKDLLNLKGRTYLKTS